MKVRVHEPLPHIRGILAGTDEAGRGPLAGNVVAAAVILDTARPIAGLDDSKKLGEARRDDLAQCIREQALAWSVASVPPRTIDEINILQAALLAMQQAIESLDRKPDHVFVDGNHLPRLACHAHAIIKGDARVAEISAASILAKVERDRQMQQLHARYPQYGFDRHKGYPTKAHRQLLEKLGPCPAHRRSFAPVRAVLSPARP